MEESAKAVSGNIDRILLPLRLDVKVSASCAKKTAEMVEAYVSELEGRVERMQRTLDFFGVELLDDGGFRYKPSTMDKWRRIQNERGTLEP